ncbi:MAG: glycosyltransferase family 4 protein [Deltaproteobacteria bacterium]|nr:glycosyltransferase family 4 protein [Deltaproteobacteria bacterium]
MKVAYILGAFPVYSETFIVREVLELQRKGFKVLVFAINKTAGLVSSNVVHAEAATLMKDVCYYSSLRNKVSKFQLAAHHLCFLVLNPIRYLRTFGFSISHSRKIFRVFLRSVLYAMKLRGSNITHIHAHFALDACELAMVISMLTGIPYSFTVHAHDIFIPGLSRLVEEKFNRAKFVACISEYNKNYILKEYPAVDPDNIKIIHCGIDVRSLTPAKKESDKFTVLAVGRFHEQKGFKYLIQACNVLRKQLGSNFVCKIIGEGKGKERPELEEIITRYDLHEVVHLLGAMEQTAVIRALKHADVFVLPCVIAKTGAMDGIPVALMEAMAMEIPVISTRVSGIPELVKNGGGILIEIEDPDGLATAIEKVFRLSDDERKEIGKRGRAIIAEDFNLAKEVHKLAELFRT